MKAMEEPAPWHVKAAVRLGVKLGGKSEEIDTFAPGGKTLVSSVSLPHPDHTSVHFYDPKHTAAPTSEPSALVKAPSTGPKPVHFEVTADRIKIGTYAGDDKWERPEITDPEAFLKAFGVATKARTLVKVYGKKAAPSK